MLNDQSMVPPPEIVREKLAQNLQECKILRKLLQLSEQAAKNRAAGEHYERAAVESAARRIAV